MTKQDGFVAFPQKTLSFLRGLGKNNTKKWFDEHRDDYDDFYVTPAKEFVIAVGKKLTRIAPQIVADPKINGSIFRINKDVRFSKDKRPYKDHLDFAFWEGEKKSSSSSLFFRLSPDGVFVGAGTHSCPQLVKSLRRAVSNDGSGKQLAAIARKLRKAGVELQGHHYKRMPRGFADDGPAAEFLLYNALYVTAEEEASIACEPGLIDLCVKRWTAALPLHRWLIEHVR